MKYEFLTKHYCYDIEINDLEKLNFFSAEVHIRKDVFWDDEIELLKAHFEGRKYIVHNYWFTIEYGSMIIHFGLSKREV